MKKKTEDSTPDADQALAEFNELPEETKRLMELKHEAEIATGTKGAKIQKRIHKHSQDK